VVDALLEFPKFFEDVTEIIKIAKALKLMTLKRNWVHLTTKLSQNGGFSYVSVERRAESGHWRAENLDFVG
jgi:hypothetical protein